MMTAAIAHHVQGVLLRISSHVLLEVREALDGAPFPRYTDLLGDLVEVLEGGALEHVVADCVARETVLLEESAGEIVESGPPLACFIGEEETVATRSCLATLDVHGGACLAEVVEVHAGCSIVVADLVFLVEG